MLLNHIQLRCCSLLYAALIMIFLYAIHYDRVNVFMTWLLEPFTMIGFSPVAAFRGWDVCFVLLTVKLFAWSAAGADRRLQTKSRPGVCPAPAACSATSCCLYTKEHIGGVVQLMCSWDGGIIILQNYYLDAWFPGDTIQLRWQATLSETTGAWL